MLEVVDLDLPGVLADETPAAARVVESKARPRRNLPSARPPDSGMNAGRVGGGRPDSEAESVLLSCVLKGAPVEAIDPEVFQDPVHRAIFDACLWVNAQGHQPSPALLFVPLLERFPGGTGPTIGELNAIDALVPTSASFPPVLEKVREAYAQRRRSRLAAMLNDSSVTVEAIQSELARIEAISAGRRSTSDWPEPVSARDLVCNPPPTPPVLIDGVLYQGGTMLVAGPSKAAKTWTLLDAGVSIAGGTEWMGHKTAGVPVLYLNLELPDFAVARRIEMICRRRGVASPEALKMENLRGRTTTLADLKRMLPPLIRRGRFGAVVVDPHYKISSVSGLEENSNDDQGRLLTELESMCSGNGAALLLCHHFAKGDASAKNAIDRASGGGVFARWPDAFLTMTPHEEEGAMTLELVLRSFPPIAAQVVRWDCPVWVPDTTLDPARIKKPGRSQQYPAERLLEILKDGMTSTEWKDAAGWSDGSFHRKRRELARAGRVRETSGCYYREGVEQKEQS